MNRTTWLARLLLALLGLGLLVRLWPSPEVPRLACDADQVRLDNDGIAFCSIDGQGRVPPVEALLSLGGRVDLNRADAETLARLPGISRSLAEALTEEREARGPFLDWEEVESVRGVGPTKLRALQASTEIR